MSQVDKGIGNGAADHDQVRASPFSGAPGSPGCVKHGVDLRTVKELLGHSTIETTMRYAHFAPNHALRAVAEVEKIEDQELSNGTILVGQKEV